MDNILSKAAQSVQDALSKKGASCKVVELWAAAGRPNAVFSLKGKDLLDLTDGKAISIKY